MRSNTPRRTGLVGTLALAISIVGLFASPASAKVIIPDLEKVLPTFEWEILCYEDGDAGWGVMWTSTDEHHSYEVEQGANGMALSASAILEPASGGPKVVETGVLIPESHGVLSNAQLKVDDVVVWGPQDLEFDCRDDLPASSISVDPEWDLPTPVSIPTTSTTVPGTETVEPAVLSADDEVAEMPVVEAAAAPAMLPRTGVSTTIFVVVAVVLAFVGEALLLLATHRKLSS